MPVETNSHLTKNRALIEAEVGQHVLLYDGISQQFHALDVGAMVIWRFLDATDALDDLATELARWFSGPPEPSVVVRDVESLLKSFVSLGLVVSTTDKSSGKWKQEVRLEPPSNRPPYEAPGMRTYSKDWIKENHPAAFFEVAFSDMWGPGGGQISGSRAD